MPLEPLSLSALTRIKDALVRQAVLHGDQIDTSLIMDRSQILPLFFLDMEQSHVKIWNKGSKAQFILHTDSLFGVHVEDGGDIPFSIRAMLFYHSLKTLTREGHLDLDPLVHRWSPMLDGAMETLVEGQSYTVFDILHMTEAKPQPQLTMTVGAEGQL